MKALTVQQPWPWAIAAGHKTIENRTWWTDHRGLLAIHAGKAWDDDGEPTFLRIMAELEVLPPKWYREPNVLPRGVVVAVAVLADICIDSRNKPTLVCDCGPWAMPGQYHWRLTDVHALAEPVPARGYQQLWEVDIAYQLLEREDTNHGR